MDTHRMGEETVERLLAGTVPVPRGGPEVLVRLLAAVRAAPRPHELVGEAAAVRAFRAARTGPVRVVASRPEWIPRPPTGVAARGDRRRLDG
ncbi:hypothetical protein GA0074695_5192 [Micromonospora viridifaciens]|uniref:Uncharacterized protein n=1 Tax=Micromonospora viridifaciens TaxID=1881 RepID=A0A1C4Z820_MICVI|nr:hypothetical protein [Micromonospora viridifaciens]SCF28861.1 hypothetical protein GA0074695_5192 [Micromonospora viridifaciens]